LRAWRVEDASHALGLRDEVIADQDALDLDLAIHLAEILERRRILAGEQETQQPSAAFVATVDNKETACW
jgi:hypothetical protein